MEMYSRPIDVQSCIYVRMCARIVTYSLRTRTDRFMEKYSRPIDVQSCIYVRMCARIHACKCQFYMCVFIYVVCVCERAFVSVCVRYIELQDRQL